MSDVANPMAELQLIFKVLPWTRLRYVTHSDFNFSKRKNREIRLLSDSGNGYVVTEPVDFPVHYSA